MSGADIAIFGCRLNTCECDCVEMYCLRLHMRLEADGLAGFPTEAKDVFADAAGCVQEARIARRRATGHRRTVAHLDGVVGSVQRLLVENNGMAHTEGLTLVAAPGLLPKSLVSAEITGHDGKCVDMQLIAAQAA